MAKNCQRVKANHYHFGQLWPLFQVLKSVQKQRQTAFDSFSKILNVILDLFKPFLRS